MAEPKFIEARTVLFVDLPEGAKEDFHLFEKTIKAAVEYYNKIYGIPKRIWVNGNDCPADLDILVSNIRVEKRGGCARGKVMVL